MQCPQGARLAPYSFLHNRDTLCLSQVRSYNDRSLTQCDVPVSFMQEVSYGS